MGAVFQPKGELSQLFSFLEAEYSGRPLTGNRWEGAAGGRPGGALWGERSGVEEPEAGLPTHLFPREPLCRNNRHGRVHQVLIRM